jgi:S-formylglutathione hydrolase FrmB
MSRFARSRLGTILAVAAVFAAAQPGYSASSIVRSQVPAPALGRPLPANIYIPDGEAPDGGWPVLYLLHGHDGNEESWKNLGDIKSTLDRLIAEGTVQPVLVVMPGVGNSWYVDSAGVGGPGNYQTAMTNDLVQWVEASYPVRSDVGGRAVAGLSMGGFGALHLAYSNPKAYGAVASMSGAIWDNVPDEDVGKTPDELKLIADSAFFHRIDRYTIDTSRILPSTGDHYAGAFGSPFDARLFNAQNVFTLAQDAVDAGLELPRTYLTVGDDDGFNLWRGAIALHETLLADGRSSELRITDGDHVWSLWKVAIKDVLVFIDAQWTAPPQPAGAE